MNPNRSSIPMGRVDIYQETPLRLRDKVVIIGGAGQNMSRAIALLFAQEGAKVVLAARTPEKMDETVRRIEAAGGQALAVQADLGDDEQVRGLVSRTVEAFGGVDSFIHAAGGFFSVEHDIAGMEADYWQKALENNLNTLFLSIKRIVPSMAERGGGCVVTLSAGERVRQDANPAYAAAKGGMVAAARNLARELYPQNIRMHAISPGIIWEPLASGPVRPAAARLERLGSPVDVAYAALWLCSDEAAWVTGLELTIDGGDSLFIDSPVRRKALDDFGKR
ncbi:MAG: SDR family oxidoreductase [Armatimonadetes bacterium]|nr:SDR family oxidoreductase [Armatimonadota bacterium]